MFADASYLDVLLDKTKYGGKTMPDKITYSEFEEKVRDLNIPDKDLIKYFHGNIEHSKPFAPALKFNEDLIKFSAAEQPRTEAALAFNSINSLARFRRKLWFGKRKSTSPDKPILVSEGDSWFQFPLLLEDTIDNLIDKGNSNYQYNIYSLGAAGDTTENMIYEKPEYLDALDEVTYNGGNLKGLVFSGGGNDILGEDKDGRPVFHKLLNHNVTNPNIDNVFDDAAVDAQFIFIKNAYTSLIETVHRYYPALPIFIHGYDYVYPGNFSPADKRNPIYAKKEQWIGNPMAEIGITEKQLQRQITTTLLDRFNELQRELIATYENLYLVETLGTLQDVSMWNDEIHPNDEGFVRIYQKFHTIINEVING